MSPEYENLINSMTILYITVVWVFIMTVMYGFGCTPTHRYYSLIRDGIHIRIRSESSEI
uniref:Uncharacterized protein n=1 Tax=viral metagenome TaxID=1070528 RepID=A0A6C0JVL2_9ZZZZ